MKKYLLGLLFLLFGLQISGAKAKTLCSIYSPSGSAQEIYILADTPFSYSLAELPGEKALYLYGLTEVLPHVFYQLKNLGLSYKSEGEKLVLYFSAPVIEVKRLKPYLVEVELRR